MTSYGGVGGIMSGRPIDIQDPFEMAVNKCFGDVMRSDKEACKEVWSALANTGWRHKSGDSAAYSFRAAGDMIAAIIGRGNYLEWYCCGPEEIVSSRFATVMALEGWSYDPKYYDFLED